MAAKLSDPVDETSPDGGPCRHTNPRVQRTYRSWKHRVVLPPTCHLGPWPGGHCPVTLIQTLPRDTCDFDRTLGAVPPPSHSWMAPFIEDMLHDARTRLTKAAVIGPGRAYGRCSMGEGLTMDEARDATFLLTGAGMWVGKISLPCCRPHDNPRS